MYLLFIVLAALCSAVIKTIDRHYSDSIFNSTKKFWQPSNERWFSAMNLCYVGKLLFMVLAIVVTQIPWWQISFHKIHFIFQVLLILIVYAGVNLISMGYFIHDKNDGHEL